MIKTFANKQLMALWVTGKPKIDARFHKRILRRLDALDTATAPEDMNTFPVSTFTRCEVTTRRATRSM